MSGVLGGRLLAQDATPGQAQADPIFKELVGAVLAHDYDSFIAHGTTEVKAAITKTQFNAVADLMDARLKAGYEVASLGELNQRGYQVFLYRLRYQDGGDDTLGTMTLKNGQVAGIYFK